ncbi:TPM domain-containing protein [Orbus mooreae]|uniref:TPM domain-containing protein n=1 Tax=Orbus mooreae TaxID=3074107 RepID=UPI00370D7D94
MNHIKYFISCIVLLLVFTINSVQANSYTIDSVPNPYQQSNVTYVVDPENILSPTDSSIINQRLQTLEQNTSIETAVVALPSIGQIDTREFANKLFNHWKIGKKDKDNGLLILLVIDQREVVFEVGYGLEGNLTDAKSYRLMDQYMLPLFKQNQFSEGMRVGVDGVASYLEQQSSDGTLYTVGNNKSSLLSFLPNNPSESLGIKFYITIGIVLLLAIYSFWGDRIFMIKDWATAQYVSPLGRFKKALLFIWVWAIVLLFIFGVSGISQYWLITIFQCFAICSVLLICLLIGYFIFYILRSIGHRIFSIFSKNSHANKPKALKKLICPTCRHRSIIEITENKESKLNEDEKYLMNIGAVTYRFFSCERPSCLAMFSGSKVNLGWKMCPDCQLPTNHLIKSTRVEPTYSQSGLRTDYYLCEKCKKESIETKILPRKQRSSSSGSGGSGGSSGSSGGSRGGGSSGGGGSRGRF